MVTYLEYALRALIATVFAVSAISKSRQKPFRLFVMAIQRLRIIPFRISRSVAVAVVIAEYCSAVAVAVLPPVGFAAAVLLLLGFVVVILRATRNRLVVACPCFGGSGANLGMQHVWRNLVLMTVSLIGLALSLNDGREGTSVSGSTVAVAAGGLLAIIVSVLDEIISLFGDDTRVVTDRTTTSRGA